MDNSQTNKWGMLLKVHEFYKTNGSIFNPIPHYPPLIAQALSLLKAITKTSNISTANSEGMTEAKYQTREDLEEITGKMSSALLGYGLVNGDTYIIEQEDYNSSSLDVAMDSELYVLAMQLYKLALPVQGSLVPYGSGPADVAKLNTVADAFLPQIRVARNQRKIKGRAVEQLKELFKEMDELLAKFDGLMLVFKYNNPNLWSQYRSARKIEKRGGGHTLHKKQGKVLAGNMAHAPFDAEVMKAKAKLILTNTKNKVGDLIFYFSAKPNEKPTAKTKLTTVIFSKPVKITATEAGYTVHTPYLHVLNPNVRVGTWKAEVETK